MTQYNRVNVKLSNSQLNKLKSAIKNENDAVIRLSPNMILMVILMIKLIFHMNYYQQTDKFQVFVRHLLIIHQ